jgi:hypothetical protein
MFEWIHILQNKMAIEGVEAYTRLNIRKSFREAWGAASITKSDEDLVPMKSVRGP